MIPSINKILLWTIQVVAFEIIVVIIGKLTGSGWHSRNFTTGAIFRAILGIQGALAALAWLVLLDNG